MTKNCLLVTDGRIPTQQKSGGDSRMFQRFRDGKKDGPRELPCLFRWRRPPPVAKTPKGLRRAISPQMTSCQNVKAAPAGIA